MRLLAVLVLFVLGCSSSPERKDPAPTDRAFVVDDSEQGDDDLAIAEITEEEVEFPSGDITLRGTVVRPAASSGPRPAAIVLHDFGPIGRDGVISETFAVSLPVEVPVYRAIAEHLASRGFVVLLFDKRTCVKGSAPGCEYPRSYIEGDPALGDALVRDATAAATWLAERKDVAADAISFIGHGQGAEVAVVAASESGGIARVAMLAPSANSLQEIVQWQTARSAELLEERIAAVGDTPEADLLKKQLSTLRTQEADQKAAFAKLKDVESNREVLGLPAATWTSYAGLHANFLESLRTAKVEALAVLPDEDQNYPRDSAARMETIMRAQGDGHFVLVTEVTHPLVGIGAQDDPTIVSPIVLRVVTSYLSGE